MWLPSRWLNSLTQELSSSSAFFPRKVKVTDALAFSTAKIPVVDRINQLNLSMKNKKSLFFRQHSVTDMLLLYLVIMLLFLSLVFSGVLCKFMWERNYSLCSIFKKVHTAWITLFSGEGLLEMQFTQCMMRWKKITEVTSVHAAHVFAIFPFS